MDIEKAIKKLKALHLGMNELYKNTKSENSEDINRGLIQCQYEVNEILMLLDYDFKQNYKTVEIDIWTDKVERFRTEFASMNDCKFDGIEVIAEKGVDKRYSLLYRVFSKKIKYPEQGYYQLNNAFETE